MKIGILTYHSAINFGANLQAFSTYNYLRNHGYTPIFINYSPDDFNEAYASFPKKQIDEHIKFLRGLNITRRCNSAEEIAKVLDEDNINNIIIGSDAVAQHHPFQSRIIFPSRTIVSVSRITSDRMFPNPFWGDFLRYRPNTNVCLMSVSSQQTAYKLFSSELCKQMYDLVSKFSYISVRDTWTQHMYEYLSNATFSPIISPDPVFAFNYNCEQYIPSRDEILKKYSLPQKYVLLSLRRGKSVSPQWSKDFEIEVEKKGYKCVGLPFPYGFTNLNCVTKKIDLPLNPMDWYSIIKYSSGYVGHNMHTIVSALHNSVPCYSLDQYGQRKLMQFCNDPSSKIYDILKIAGFEEYRAISGTLINQIPAAKVVVEKLLTFDHDKCKKFADSYLVKYKEMMLDIEKTFI